MKFTQTWQQTGSGGFSSKARIVWDRITFSRLTVLYVVFSSIYFIVQLALQIRGFTINANAASFLARIVEEGNATSTSLPFQHKSTIGLCHWVDGNLNTDGESCRVIWSGDRDSGIQATFQEDRLSSSVSLPDPTPLLSTTVSQSSTPTATLSLAFSTPTTSPSVTTIIVVVPTGRPAGSIVDADDLDADDDDDEEDEVRTARSGSITITTLSKRDHAVSLNGEQVVLSDICLEALNWPLSQLRNTKREDIVFIGFQFWVLGMSFVALLNESIPHILASLLTHVMVTAWAAFQITQTESFRTTFSRVITNGACRGSPALLTNFWKARSQTEFPALAIHAAALLLSCVLTWKLVKLYGWQTFKRVGASLTINRFYKIVLILSITIQLSLFFMIVTVCLWVDQLFNSAIGDIADFTKLYKASSFITLALMVPWLTLGWFAVRREHRLQMFFFLVLCILYLAGWGVMFFSTTFRWTFVTWRFFAVMATASVFLTCLSFIFGVICRFNFGRGLLRYLNSQDSDSMVEDDDHYSDEKKDLESFAVPGFQSVVPTFAAAYGQDSYYSPPSMAPASYAEAPPYSGPVPVLASPPPAVTRNLTDIPQVRRSDSNSSSGSDKSHASLARHLQARVNDHTRQGSQSSSQSGGNKRWVIE